MAESFLDKLLSQIGVGSKDIIFASITPGIGLEMLKIDTSVKMVKAYGSRPLEYNDSMREITSYENLRAALSELFTELHISPKSSIYFSMPSVLVGKIDLPLLLNDDAITEAITSTVEQAYIFKRCEPVVSWFEVLKNVKSESRTIMYSALQKPALDNIKSIISDFGGTLNLVENSIISILRALAFTDLANVQMQDDVAWNLMIINSTGYSIVSMVGQDIIDYYEEPIAFKTYELAEIYNAINSSAQLSLMNYPANYLYIISQTDMVNAEHLATTMQFDGKINYYDDNSFKKEDIISISLDIIPSNVKTISLEAIGIAVSTEYAYPVSIDYTGNNKVETGSDIEKTLSIVFKGKEVVLTELVLKKMSFVVLAILILPLLIALLTLPPLDKQRQAKLDEINKQIEVIDKDIKKITEETSGTGTFDVTKEIEKVLKLNRVKIMTYSAIGESVPKNLWITYFSTDVNGKIMIKGICDDVEGVYLFFKNMKDYLVDSQLRLYKLEMLNPTIDSALTSVYGYQFEVTNKSDAELSPPENAEGEGQGNDNGDPKGKSKGKKVKDLEQVKVN